MIDLHPNEKISLIIRRHWFVFLKEIIALIIAFLLPVLFIFFSGFFYQEGGDILTEPQITSVLTFLSFAWFLILWMVFFVVFTNYYLDTLIITNQRVIDVEQIGLFARDIATAPLEAVQDIKIEILGIVATALNYGNLYLQTAGESREIIIRGIKNPEHVKKLIMSTYQSSTPRPHVQA